MSQARQAAKTAEPFLWQAVELEITGKYAELGQYGQALKLAEAIEDESERNRWIDLLNCALSQPPADRPIQKNLLKNAPF